MSLSSTMSTGRSCNVSSAAGLDCGGSVARGKPRGEMKSASFARLAFDPNASAHHLHKLRRDRQAQAGAAVFARRRGIGLAERLENLRLLFGRDADAGVAHGNVQAELPVGVDKFWLDVNDDFPAAGELNGVADEVDNDLPQSTGVADQFVGHVRRNTHGQLQALCRPLGTRACAMLCRASPASRTADCSSSSLPASILEKSRMSLRIDSSESADDLTMFWYSRCSAVRSVLSSSSVMPRMPFIGVRISWLILARKLLLAPLAASAAFLRLLQLGVGAVQRRRVPPDEDAEDDDVRQHEQRQPHQLFEDSMLLGIPPQPAHKRRNENRHRQTAAAPSRRRLPVLLMIAIRPSDGRAQRIPTLSRANATAVFSAIGMNDLMPIKLTAL